MDEKKTKEKRAKAIKIRLTEQEHQQLQEIKTGQLASWIRKTCLNHPSSTQPIKKADPELLIQLSKIGTNLNQIAKQVNTFQAESEKIRAIAKLAIIQEQLNEILSRYDC